MKYTEQQEIDLLLSEISDQGASAELMQRLEGLLRDRPDLQDYYAKLTKLNTLLTYELHGSLQHLQPLVLPDAPKASADESASIARCNELSKRLGRDLVTTGPGLANGSRRFAWLAAATAVCLMLAVGYHFSSPVPSLPTADQSLANSSSAAGVSASALAGGDHTLVVRDSTSLNVLSRLIRTDALLSLRLPQCELDGTANVTLCSGTAWMERAPGDHERGYLVALEPGCLMDVFVDTDAEGQNALGVVEINPEGQMTGSTIAFNNLVEGDVQVRQRRTGSIGNYSVYNDSPHTKFYLFAGSHLLSGPEDEGMWHQSDYRVLYESGHLLVIGWDDSGCTVVDEPHVPPDANEARDLDFNDISAIIRFTEATIHTPSESKKVEYDPPPLSEAPTADEAERGYTLDIKPNQELVMTVSSSAYLQNSIKVIEVPSRKVLWQQDGTSPDRETNPFQQGERGVYVVRNSSDRVQRIELYSRHQPDPDAATDQWRTSPYKVLAEGDASITVGFEDSPDAPSKIDWNDIRVHARWFSM